MVTRLAAPALTAMLLDVIPLRPAAPKSIVMVSALLYERLEKVANPLTAVTLVVPCNAALPALRVAVTTVLLSVLRKLPKASKIRITGAGENATPAVAEAGACVWIARLAAGPAFTVNAALTAL